MPSAEAYIVARLTGSARANVFLRQQAGGSLAFMVLLYPTCISGRACRGESNPIHLALKSDFLSSAIDQEAGRLKSETLPSLSQTRTFQQHFIWDLSGFPM